LADINYAKEILNYSALNQLISHLEITISDYKKRYFN
jgi:hypothetical protein